MGLAIPIAQPLPAATWLNPVCLIRDLFYTVYYYDTLIPFALRLATCMGIAAALLTVSAACMRRSAHEHL